MIRTDIKQISNAYDEKCAQHLNSVANTYGKAPEGLPNSANQFYYFENLLNRYAATSSTFKPSQITLRETLLYCWDQLIESCADDEEGSIKQKKLTFLREQFLLALYDNKHSRRYSPQMMVYSFMIHMLSPACYDGLRANGLLTLPHEHRLLQLSRCFGVAVNNSHTNHHFLRIRCDELEEREKYVVVQLDEVYVKRKIEYKNGKLYGHAENGGELIAAKTILAVMISSAYASFKEVAALRPVHKLTGEDLFEIITSVCSVITRCGFKIVIIISDNNRVNRKLFEKLCGTQRGNLKDVTFHVTADISTEGKVFCTYDSVHAMKCLRNNWLNEKSKTFCFPVWDNFDKICFAKFSVLRDIYEKEKTFLIKTAPKLNFKTVYPSNLERQQVTLALNIIDESTIAAVKQTKEKETAAFMEIIWSWWNIMNIKNKFVHFLKRKDIAKPFTSITDDRLQFLRRFLMWLEHWNPVPKNGGFLTKDTHSALYRQTAVMIQFIEYSLTELKIPYVLPGKLQTDMLEKRFSRYRSLSGNNYNISVAQVLESETKLRITSLLGLKSARFGKLPFHVDALPDAIHDTIDVYADYPQPQDLDFYTDFFDDDFETIEFSQSALIFISGYVSYKMGKILSCQQCLDVFISKELVHDQYFENINRGGLSVPTQVCIELGKLALLTMQQLISAKYESSFLKSYNHKKLLKHLFKESLLICFDYNIYDVCVLCGIKFINLYIKTFPIFSNILLNNYSKCVNNTADSMSIPTPTTSRKLCTLKK